MGELYVLKRAIGARLGWSVASFELISSGIRGGRPVWGVEHYDSKVRYSFTAFGADDIYDVRRILS